MMTLLAGTSSHVKILLLSSNKDITSRVIAVMMMTSTNGVNQLFYLIIRVHMVYIPNAAHVLDPT